METAGFASEADAQTQSTLNAGQSANDDLQIGIVSFGDGCGRNLPSVYTSTGVSIP